MWTAARLANGAAEEIVYMQYEPQRGMGRPPVLPSVVYVRVHHFRGQQFFTETSADVNGETIDLLNVVPMPP